MKKHILLLSCLVLLLFSSICHATNQAGFDCKKASTPTEKFICSDSDLSLNDAVLAENYNNGMKFLSPEEKSKLKSEQKAWLAKRDKACRQSPDANKIDKSCLNEMYEERIKELAEKTLGLKRLDLKPPRDLQLFIDEKLSEALIGSSPAYYYCIRNHQYILEYYNGILFVDTKKKAFDTIIRGNVGESIDGAIRGGGITWLIASSRTAHQGHVSGGYQAIMIKDKNTGGEPYQLLDLAGESTLDDVMGKSDPCPDLEDDEKDFGSFTEIQGYDVKDVNGDGINDMIFHIKEYDCEKNKSFNIKETYYFLPEKPYIKSTVQKSSSTKLPKFIPRVGHTFWVSSVAFSPDGRYALSGSWDGSMKLWDVATGDEIRTFKESDDVSVYAVAISPDGHNALSGSDNKLKLWDIATGEKIRSFKEGHTGIESAVVFSSDGRYAISGGSVSDDNGLILWDITTGEKIRNFESKKTTSWGWINLNAVNSIAFSPDGRYALSLSFNSAEMMLWDVATGKGIRTFTGHLGVIESVAFSPDGRYALSGSGDRTIKMWDVTTGKEIRTFKGHSNIVKSVAFSPDGRYVLSASGDKTLKLWDIATGKEIRTFEGHQESVNSAAFSSDGRYALSGSEDYTVKLWDINTGKEIRTFGHPPYIKDNAKGKKSNAKKSQQDKVDVGAKDENGNTPLMNESEKGNIKKVRDLLASGADVNAKSEDGKTALIFASSDGYLDVVQALLASGADVNASDDKGNTALTAASVTIYVEVVKKLVEAGADINARNKDGVTALMLASGYGRTGLVVTDMKGKMEIVTNDPVGNGNVEVVKALIAAKADVNIRSGKNGRTALIGASRFGYVAVVKELLSAKADVNAKSDNGDTALIEASRYGHIEVVRELLAAKADVNVKNNDGGTALMEASKGYDEVVKLLRGAGAVE
jgi:WD40 repeat protein/uncharacterized protein YecT (DUF1311 family)